MSTILSQPAFKVIGIKIRVCNRDLAQLKQDLGGLWQRFFSENIMQKVPHISSDIYEVFTNYEGDYLDPYDTIIGLKVAMDAVVPGASRCRRR